MNTALDNPRIGGAIPRILERLGTQPAIKILLPRFTTPDDTIRSEVHCALARLRSSGIVFDLPAAAMREMLLDEMRSYAWIVLRADVAAKGTDELLDKAIAKRLRQPRDLIFVLLGLRSAKYTQQVRRVRQAPEAVSDTLRALVIEQLDNLTEHRIKAFLLPLRISTGAIL